MSIIVKTNGENVELVQDEVIHFEVSPDHADKVAFSAWGVLPSLPDFPGDQKIEVLVVCIDGSELTLSVPPHMLQQFTLDLFNAANMARLNAGMRPN